MEYLIVILAAVFVSGLTLFSGFGLGTLLMPVFALFFPIELAVAGTAVVHGANNCFKIAVVGKDADKELVFRFGVPAIITAFIGAAVLGLISQAGEIFSYSIAGKLAVITPVKLSMGILMLIFAGFELLPGLRELKFERKYLFIGGLFSGFFGGFSGHQGALRSAFLAKTGVSAEAFVGTNAVIGFMVDMARLAIYLVFFLFFEKEALITSEHWSLILTGCLAAFAGVIIGKRYLHKVTIKTIQTITGVLLMIIALALGSGMI